MPLSPRLIKNNPAKFVRKVGVFSLPGVGKTELIGTIADVPQMKEIYHLDLDGGTATLQSRGDIEGEATKLAADVERVLWAFLNKESETLKYHTLVIDGFSALCKRELEEMTVAKSKDPTFKEWGKVATLSTRLVHLIKDLPITTIINTWSTARQPKIPGTDTVDETAPFDIKPDVPPGAYNSFMGSVDDCFYLLATKDGSRYLYTDRVETKASIIHAKMRDRAVVKQFTTEVDGKTHPIVKNPTWTDLFARYQLAFAK